MDVIAILDFGGQYCHLISRRIRDLGVRAEIFPAETKAVQLTKRGDIAGIILSGGARSVYEKNAPKFDQKILGWEIPVLGICYGHQLIAHVIGGKVTKGKTGEYGLTSLAVARPKGILRGLRKKEPVWMNHKDAVQRLPKSCQVLARTSEVPVAAFECTIRKLYGVQFHPEVSHTERGEKILETFVFGVCKAKKSWTAKSLVKEILAEAKESIGTRRAIIGLSGGIDSSVAAVLVSQAIGKQLTAVYVDTGLMRQAETAYICKAFKASQLRLKVVDASGDFFTALKGVRSPERKRKIMGRLFVDIFTREARREGAEVLIQGTIYSDRIESGSTKHSSVIKSHHNVGGLPKKLDMDLYEPLKDLYKDEVRELARELKLPKQIRERQIFPGPGLAIRIIGEVTPKRAEIVREASAIVEEELSRANLTPEIWMGFAVLLPIKSVGIQGDARSYKYPIAVRIIESRDAMTANFAKVPWNVLEIISQRITNEISDVNRVVYDITNKPPATMEWE